jgi:hypothetical protein
MKEMMPALAANVTMNKLTASITSPRSMNPSVADSN